MKLETRYYPNLEEISRRAARFIVDLARQRVEQTGCFTFVLSGGHTPRLLYTYLASPRFADEMPWGQTCIFWGDERCVPVESSESNYAMARQTLLTEPRLPPENIFRMPGEISPPEEAAAEYEQRLREFFKPAAPERFPSFDLILLGMGGDGHTASLFPGDPALDENHRWVVSVAGLTAKPPVPRLTLTLPVINEAGSVAFLVSGKDKHDIVKTIWENPDDAGLLYPSARVRARDRLIWFTDCPAD